MIPLSRLGEKILTEPTCVLRRSFCIWSDLLGFGNAFAEANWLPDPEVWQQQAIRIGNAYRSSCQHIGSLGGSYLLLLNDGIVRALPWSQSFGPFDLAFWLREAIFSHFHVCRDEFAKNLPGLRTIISSGWIAEHSFHEVTLDDCVLDYTRQKAGLSALAEMAGNPILVSNPVQLQLNTAFSRSFLLDEAGSRAGISGAQVYMDDQFLKDVEDLFKDDSRYRIKKWPRRHDMVFAVEYTESANRHSLVGPEDVLTKDEWTQRCLEERRKAAEAGCIVLKNGSTRRPWAFGLLLETPTIEVKLPNLETIVHRVLGFFPPDEDPSDFMLELWPIS